MIDSDDLAGASVDELAAVAHAAINELAERGDPAAFQQLLVLTRVVGESLGTAARATAERGSWAGVAEIAGTTRQAAWERWRHA